MSPRLLTPCTLLCATLVARGIVALYYLLRAACVSRVIVVLNYFSCDMCRAGYWCLALLTLGASVNACLEDKRRPSYYCLALLSRATCVSLAILPNVTCFGASVYAMLVWETSVA